MAIDYGTVRDGALRTDTENSSGIPIDMEARTKNFYPENYTTKTMMSKFGKTISAKDMNHKYRERRPIPNWTTISVPDAVGQSHIEVTDYTYIKNDQVLWILRGGAILMQLLVQDASIDATVDVVVFTGTTGSGTLATATEVGDIVIIGPEAHAEGEAVPTAFTNISVDKYDYLLQCDRAVKKTDIDAHIAHYDNREQKLAADLKMAWVEEMAKLNLALFVATETKEVTSASGPRRYMFHGLINRLTENNENFSGVGSGFTKQALQETLRKTIDDSPGGGKKIFIAGVNANANISAWPEGSIRVSPNSKKWGINVRVVETQYGPVGVIYDNVLTARYGMADRAFILDSAHIKGMNLQGMKIKAFYNITTARDIHNMEHAISGTWGCQTSCVEAMAQMKGIS